MTWSLFSSLSGGDSHDLDDDEFEHRHGHKKNDGGKSVPITRTTFELADNLYAEAEESEAELEETDTVYLFFFFWLGVRLFTVTFCQLSE
jgi:hypothetical protein